MPHVNPRLFEYVVIFHPEQKKDADGNIVRTPSKLLVDVTRIIAKDDKEVGMKAAREIPEEFLSDLDRVEIIIRPFN